MAWNLGSGIPRTCPLEGGWPGSGKGGLVGASQAFTADSLLLLWPFPGVIRTAVANLDRETQDRYEVVIRATDMAGQLGGLSGSTTVTIVITDVNDNPPRFPQSECLCLFPILGVLQADWWDHC